MRNVVGVLVAVSVCLVGASALAADSPYLQVVQRTADALLANARDTHGDQRSGMILSVLDRSTARPLDKLPKAPGGVRSSDRTGPGGSNANLQQDLYRTLQHLTRLTGDPRYAQAAQLALVDFLKITQHPDTGLVAWGEHLYWDCVADHAGDLNPKKIHEPKRKLLYFDLLYAAEPERTLKFARGLWDHQIASQKTGDFSRHAAYDKHGPGSGFDFPKEGSYFIDVWSRAFEKTKEPVYQTAVNVLAGRYLKRTNNLGLLDHVGTPRQEELNNLCVTLWLISLALESHDAAARMDPQTAELLRKLAAAQDQGFLGLDHHAHDPARGFVCYANTDSGKLHPRADKKSDGHSRHWGMGYGVNPTAMFGLLCYSRQAQIGPGTQGDAYRRLVVQTADLYTKVDPQPKEDDIWAGEYGMAIFVEVAAFRLTGKPQYLERAKKLSDLAIEVFWDEASVLPRASTRTNYYDVISYPDTLLMALLAVHEHTSGLEPQVECSDLNR